VKTGQLLAHHGATTANSIHTHAERLKIKQTATTSCYHELEWKANKLNMLKDVLQLIWDEMPWNSINHSSTTRPQD